MTHRAVVIGSGTERAVIWGTVIALASWFAIPGLARAGLDPGWTGLGIAVAVILGAIVFSFTHNGIVPTVVLVAFPLGVSLWYLPESSVIPVESPTLLVGGPVLIPAVGVATYLVGRSAAALHRWLRDSRAGAQAEAESETEAEDETNAESDTEAENQTDPEASADSHRQ